MKKLLRTTRFLVLFTALLFTFHVQAQIDEGKMKNNGTFSVKKTYSPPPRQYDMDDLINNMNQHIEKCFISFHEKDGYQHSGSERLKFFNNRVETKAGIMFYYRDVIENKNIELQLSYIYFGVSIYVSKLWGNSDKIAVQNFEFDYMDNSNKEKARYFAENMYYILQRYRNDHLTDIADSIQFSIQLDKYRKMDIKPVVSEEQRKYIVQANSLTNDKLYKQAIDAYKKALAINPVAYPAAYFNMALLFAEKQDFERAITNMKKYLLFDPDAPDARAAQDKIYEWEYHSNQDLESKKP